MSHTNITCDCALQCPLADWKIEVQDYVCKRLSTRLPIVANMTLYLSDIAPGEEVGATRSRSVLTVACFHPSIVDFTHCIFVDVVLLTNCDKRGPRFPHTDNLVPYGFREPFSPRRCGENERGERGPTWSGHDDRQITGRNFKAN